MKMNKKKKIVIKEKDVGGIKINDIAVTEEIDEKLSIQMNKKNMKINKSKSEILVYSGKQLSNNNIIFENQKL